MTLSTEEIRKLRELELAQNMPDADTTPADAGEVICYDYSK